MPKDPADMTDDELQAHLRELRDVTARAPVEAPLPKVTVEILPWGHAPDRYVPDLSEVPPDPADPVPVRADPDRVVPIVLDRASGRWVTLGEREPLPGPIAPPSTEWPIFRCVPEFFDDPPAPAEPPNDPQSVQPQGPPDPADPVPVAFRAWEPTAADLLHSGPLWPEHFSKEHEDALRWKREGRFVRVHESAPEAPAERDPRLAGIDALIDYATGRGANPLPPLTDAEIEAALEPLRRDIEQAGGRLEWGYTESAPLAVDAVIAAIEAATAKPLPPPPVSFGMRALCAYLDRNRHRLQEPGSPADERPLTGKQARTMIADDLWPPPSSALTVPGEGRVWLPPSPVVQAALVVDPEE